MEQVGWMGFLEAIHTYNPRRGSFKTWVYQVVRCRLIDELQYVYRPKRFCVGRVYSLDELVPFDAPTGHELARHDYYGTVIAPTTPVDDQVMARLELSYVWGHLQNKLTPQERKVLEAMVVCRRPLAYGERDDHCFHEVSSMTGLSWKQVDNAWMRVKRKVAKIYRGKA